MFASSQCQRGGGLPVELLKRQHNNIWVREAGDAQTCPSSRYCKAIIRPERFQLYFYQNRDNGIGAVAMDRSGASSPPTRRLRTLHVYGSHAVSPL